VAQQKDKAAQLSKNGNLFFFSPQFFLSTNLLSLTIFF